MKPYRISCFSWICIHSIEVEESQASRHGYSRIIRTVWFQGLKCAVLGFWKWLKTCKGNTWRKRPF